MRRLLLAAGLVALAVPADAHAVLEAANPAAGARLDRAPDAVTLTFDEPVETALGSVRVLDGAGALIAGSGPIVHPHGDGRIVAVHVPSLVRGRYVVVWRVVSVDSHVVGGAYAFGVGVPAGDPPPLERDPGASILAAIVHGALLGAALLAIGLPIGAFAFVVGARGAGFVEFAAWLVVIAAAFTDIALRAEINGGTIAASFATHVGLLRTGTMMIALVGVSGLISRQRNRFVLAPACVALALSLSLAGHAADGAVPAIGVVADMLHLLAAAAWIGVLAVGITLGPSAVLDRISPVAMIAVATIVLTGVLQVVRNVGSWPALLDSPYGRAIDLKIALLIVALALAWSARRSLARGVFELRRRLAIELTILAAVVAVTAVLVDLPLPREASAAAATGSTSTAVTLHLGALDAHVALVPIDSHHVMIHAIGTDADGAVRPLDGVDASVTDVPRHAGPFAVPMTRDSAGAYSGTATLPFAGRWRAFVSARSGDFDEAHATIALPTPPEDSP
jgi:copper transport protein